MIGFRNPAGFFLFNLGMTSAVLSLVFSSYPTIALAEAADTSTPTSLTGSVQDASTLPQACIKGDPLSLVDRASASTTPCVLKKHEVFLETGYFQNASAVGGTALAAYPLVHLRYGLTNRTELFADPATAIAKSGVAGAGIYTWSKSGGGIRYAIFNSGAHALSASVEDTPQTDETASLSTRERVDSGLQYRMALDTMTDISASFGSISFYQDNHSGGSQASLYGRLSINQRFTDRLSASALVGRDAHVTYNSTPQTEIGLAVKNELSPNSVGDVEIGSALNAAGDTKAHYLGFGISFLR